MLIIFLNRKILSKENHTFLGFKGFYCLLGDWGRFNSDLRDFLWTFGHKKKYMDGYSNTCYSQTMEQVIFHNR